MNTTDTTTVFIDGQAGTTGLQITERLTARRDLLITHLSEEERKDPQARQGGLQSADIAILCLPDAASKEAVMRRSSFFCLRFFLFFKNRFRG